MDEAFSLFDPFTLLGAAPVPSASGFPLQSSALLYELFLG